MPGQIRAIEVELGESVTAGQTLMVMEAMKMEIKIQASQDGVVERIEVEVGETVEKEQLLVVVDPKISPDED
jgi:biotin carboxyl carrier protein